MSESKPRARGRERPSLPDPPFLCADCRHGSVIVQKLQPWLLAQEAWQDSYPDWFWQASCRSPKVTPWKFATFTHPVVECDGFRMRAILTTEDVALEQARKAVRKLKRRRKRKKGKRSGRK